ncbi:protein activator of alkane oxidation PraB [Pseudomonas sp. TH05]|uniref:alkane oxidation protein activator PraB n=1 Tax=unclassified Pseudomonas TaxID=196821 RepID=UPI0003551D8B|nr:MULTISPECIES: alkane oxidation protein activator PraB [unclassified Pseudomonas]EPL07146.1 protein activator of alkane oxidation PraB [Pseudomonas sp. CF161]MBK5541162.1 protein activator of alkane oxidation PraB [Pseudomonas sp. TH07]MBK5558687.1 protein activator of alkane oxidation PraB [Pseudomonas sp. TH05]OOV93022.1 protein activator of alkane oxidation PraB [Pseudomonas sp. MF4836]
MKGIKTLVSAAAIAVCLGAASMASAASIIIKDPDAPTGPVDGPFSTSAGQIVVKSPSSLQAPVTCGITFTGNVSGGIATINGASLTGGGLCALPVLKNIPSPGWVLTASSLTNGTVTNVGYTIASFPSTNCGPNTIAVTWNESTKTLSGSNIGLTGNCTIVSLSATAPKLSVTNP